MCWQGRDDKAFDKCARAVDCGNFAIAVRRDLRKHCCALRRFAQRIAERQDQPGTF